MVLDIEKYPEFVPWCLGGKILTVELIKEINTLKLQLISQLEKATSAKLIKVLLFMIKFSKFNSRYKY